MKKLCVTVSFLLCFIFYLRTISKNKRPGKSTFGGAISEDILRYEFGGLVFGGAYFRNFTVIC